MATSQQSLAQAEALYDKAVQEAKHEYSELLTAQAKVLAAKLGDYASSLSKASAGLAESANATQKGIAAVAALRDPKIDASFAVVEEQATLEAKVRAAEDDAQRMGRHRESSLQEATRQAQDQLEDAEQQLTRKLGDLSAPRADAEEILKAPETATEEQGLASGQKGAGLGKNASFAELKQYLAASKARAASEVSAAKERFSADLALVSTSLTSGTDKIKKALAAAEATELQRVRDHKVDKVPRRHRHRH